MANIRYLSFGVGVLKNKFKVRKYLLSTSKKNIVATLVRLIFIIAVLLFLFVACEKSINKHEEQIKTSINEDWFVAFLPENVNLNNKDNLHSNGSVVNNLSFSKGLAYRLTVDGSGYVVDGIGECKDTDIVIPAEYNGKPVVAIGDNAFYPLRNGKISFINSVLLPDTIMEIGGTAFAYNPLTEITFPEGLVTIKQGAFFGTMIESVSIPDSVKVIGSAAFMSLYLKSVYIGKGVLSTRLGQNAFLSMALEEINVSNKNSDLFVINEILYVRDFNSLEPRYRLEAYPNASESKSLVIEKNHILSNGSLAFAHNIEEIHIQSDGGTPCGPAFVASYRLPLIDIAKLQNGSTKLSEINEQHCIYVNESISDVYLNMTKSAFLSEKRNLYVLPNAEGMRYDGYIYHFIDSTMSVEEYRSLID